MSDYELKCMPKWDSFCDPNPLNKLLDALESGNTLKFEEILCNYEREIDVNHWFGDPHYGTLLDIACSKSCASIATLLLKYCANANCVNRERGKAPLHISTELEDVETMKILLEYCDINLKDGSGCTALHTAAAARNPQVLNILLQNSCVDVNVSNRKGQTPLHLALAHNNIDAIISLLRHPAINLEAESSRGTCREILLTKFPELMPMKSTLGKRSENLSDLLNRGETAKFVASVKSGCVDLNGNDGHNTYLQHACEYGLQDVVDALLEAGADPNQCCAANVKPPVWIAACGGYHDILRSFIKVENVVFGSINGETVLHAVVNELASLGAAETERKRDYYKCLEMFTSEFAHKVDVNEQDQKGNTVLHYAAQQYDDWLIRLFLDAGAYIGQINVHGIMAISLIPARTLRQFLDDCIVTNGKSSRDESYELVYDYKCLAPPKQAPLQADDPSEDYSVVCETGPLLEMSRVKELRPLLSHPVLASFLNLKWYKIRRYFYVNVTFYAAFWFFLTWYILATLPTTEQREAATPIVWAITAFLACILMAREMFQLSISPLKYAANLENWLEIALILVTGCILLQPSPSSNVQVETSAIAIFLSWMELVLLVGKHPHLSTQVEMFKTVCWNFLRFLAWYFILIVGFAISFFILFRDNSQTDNFFNDPFMSGFKSVVMLTGEFDASSIPFRNHPGTSHALFIAFIFLIAIILLNLLNGLAVCDTQTIKADAQLVGYISRINLVSCMEKVATGDPLPFRGAFQKITCLCCCNPLSQRRVEKSHHSGVRSFYKRINFFPCDLSCDGRIRVRPNQEAKILFSGNRINGSDEGGCWNCDIWRIDADIVRETKDILCRRQEGLKNSDGEMLRRLDECERKLEVIHENGEVTKKVLEDIRAILQNPKGRHF